MMELRHLRYFMAVAEERSFTRASIRLGMSQPPLSQQIRDLESEIGLPLFDRLPQGVALTEAGRVFLVEARDALEQAGRAMELARRAGEGASGRLRVGITATATFNTIPADILRKFRSSYPDVIVTIEEGRSIRLVERLVTDELDAVFVRPSLAFPHEVELLPVATEMLVAALPDNHPLERFTNLDLSRLAEDRFLILDRAICASFHDTVIEACRAAGFEPMIAQLARRLTSLIDLVAGGLGVALVPECMTHVRMPGVIYREISGAIASAPLAIATLRGKQRAVVRNFVDVKEK